MNIWRSISTGNAKNQISSGTRSKGSSSFMSLSRIVLFLINQRWRPGDRSRFEERGCLLQQHVLQFFSNQCYKEKKRYDKNKAELQAVGTRSAIRMLRKQSGRERRFVTCENHKISKSIVNTDFAVFALEDLKDIGKERWLDRGMKGKLEAGPITS